jgi:hypothetical protein
MRTGALQNSVLLLCFIGLSACTTSLTYEKLKSGAQPKDPGFSYYLPRQRFTVSVTSVLESCPDEKAVLKRNAELEVAQSATITESPVIDEEQHYSVPLKTLVSGWKTTTLEGTVYPNQTLHTINATIDDRTGAIIKGLIATGISIARIALQLPAGIRDEQHNVQQAVCKPEIHEALSKLEEGRTKLLDPTLDADQRAIWVAVVTTAHAALQTSVSYVFDPRPGHLELVESPPEDKDFLVRQRSGQRTGS